MATKRTKGKSDGSTEEPVIPFETVGGDQETTGRFIVLLREGDTESAARVLTQRVGVRATTVRRDDQESAEAAVASGNAIFPEIGAAVLTVDPEQMSALGATRATDSPIIAAEPERYVYAIADMQETPPDLSGLGDILPFQDEGLDLYPRTETRALFRPLADASPEYLRGYRDSINTLVDRLVGSVSAPPLDRELEAEAAWNEAHNTWGLQATNVVNSQFSGRGIKVAVLDTGFGPHADFGGRTIHAQSFVPGQTPADGHSHGTHCIGTALGSRRPRVLPRYGIAFESDILAGKVLSNAGSGQDGWILAGIDWAVGRGARVVSMSLGAPVNIGTPPSVVYEGVARRALARGTLICAAAGNDSRRPGLMRPVSHPANCPSILAVAALDENFRVAQFSNGGLNPNGGEVNIAAPGVNVLSSVPVPPFYRRFQGTSMATPHVAGIAALFAQATGLSGISLWRVIARSVRRLPIGARDVGVGMVRAR